MYVLMHKGENAGIGSQIPKVKVANLHVIKEEQNTPGREVFASMEHKGDLAAMALFGTYLPYLFQILPGTALGDPFTI